MASDSCRAIQSVFSIPEVTPTEGDVVRMQEKAGVYEHNMWLKRGAVCTSTGLWGTHDGLMLALTALLGLLITYAHGFHHCARGEMLRRISKQGFSSPYLQTMIDNQLMSVKYVQRTMKGKQFTNELLHAN